MSLESFEAVNRNRSYRAYIEKDHWASAEDPIGFDAYTLYLIDFLSGVVLTDHLYDSLDLCLKKADEDYGFDRDAWKERSERVRWPDPAPRVSPSERAALEKKLQNDIEHFRSEFSGASGRHG